MNPFKITGVGTYLPTNEVPSEQLEESLSIKKGWAARYSGVQMRYQSTFESNAFMGARAIENALDHAGLELGDLGLLVSAAATYDYPLPNQASLTKLELKDSENHTFPCIDIDTTCLSFVTALDHAAKSLNPETCRHVAIVSSEIASKNLNPNNWETSTLFGDASAAVIISVDETGEKGSIKYDMRTYCEGAMNTIMKGGGNEFCFRDHPYDPEMHSFQMNGKHLLRLAKRRLPEFMATFFEKLPFNIQDVDHVIPHQASKTGLRMFVTLFGLEEEQLESNLEVRGNCIAASIPTMFCEGVLDGRIKDGDLCLLCGTSAGFSIGANLIRF